jgi:hypothetical protein
MIFETFQIKDISDNWPPYMAIRRCDIFDTSLNCQGSPAVSRRKRSASGDTIEVTIGIENCKNKGNIDFCNGALKAGTHYQLRLRGYTGQDKYHDTAYSARIPTCKLYPLFTKLYFKYSLLVTNLTFLIQAFTHDV